MTNLKIIVEEKCGGVLANSTCPIAGECARYENGVSAYLGEGTPRWSCHRFINIPSQEYRREAKCVDCKRTFITYQHFSPNDSDMCPVCEY